jgi:hypothetical protein
MIRINTSRRTVALSAAAGAIAAFGLGTGAAAHEAGTTAPAEEHAFCAPYVGIVTQFSAEAPDPAAVEGFVAEAEATQPDEIAEPFGILLTAVESALAGDESGFESAEFGTALSVVDGWVFDNCAFDNKVDVVAVDWAFGGIPLEMPAGHAVFRLSNVGTEYHEMGIIRRLEGTTQSWDEIAHLLLTDEEAAGELVEWVGHAWAPNADTAGVAYVDLEPGEYAAFCAVPIGSLQSIPEEELEGTWGSPDADRHFMHGMLQEFTVVE